MYIERFVEIYNDIENYPTIASVADSLGISDRTVRRRASEMRADGVILKDRSSQVRRNQVDTDIDPTEYEQLVVESVRQAKQLQRARDKNRIQNKLFREKARVENAVEDLNREMNILLEERRGMFSKEIIRPKAPKGEKMGVIQLSDMHFGEVVAETLENKFDMDVASQRLRKMAERSKSYFKANDIKTIAVFLTGDQINSTRRISELTAFADSRVKVVFNAYLILGQFLEHLYEDFNITVASVVGNESRLDDYFDTTDYLVSNNFDLFLHALLKNTHEKEGLKFTDIYQNPVEQVVDVNGVNFLLVHGNIHKGLANTNRMETEVEKIKARYAASGIRIDYVVAGHIHSTYISNNFARSASLVGSNAFSERTLNFTSKASQNAYIVDKDGSIDAIMVDLQKVEGYEPYPYDRDNIRYFNNNSQRGNVVIQSVLV